MNLSKARKVAQQEARVSDLCPITHLNSPSIFETKSGLLGSVIRVQGVAFEIEEPATLNHHSHLIHQALVGLDERFMVMTTIHRKKKPAELHGQFSSKFARDLNERYMARFTNQSLYVNELYLTVILKGDTSNKTATSLTWLKRFMDVKVNNNRDAQREEAMLVLTRTVQQLKANLSVFKPQLLGGKDESLGYSELMQFLSITPNAGESLAHPTPTFCPPIAKDIPTVFQQENLYPEGNLSQYLSRYQLLFGEYVQFQGNTTSDVRFAAMLSLKKYPTFTACWLLDLMLSLDGEFISTSTFAPIAREAGLKQIESKRNKLINAEDKAASQIDSLTDLEDGIASETERLGIHHHTLMLIAPTKKKLESAVMEATKRYAQVNIPVIKETPLGIETAFWSQIPGNHHLIARASLLTSKNFVNFAPLHNTQSQFHGGNHLGSAVTLLETPSKTPVFFNYHTEGSSTNPSKGHTAVFGGNNAGKTTLVSFLDAQMGRFGGKSFFIDRDESAKIYILACGNSAYTKIAPSNPIAMNPLKLPDTPENRSFLKAWFATLIQQEGEASLPGSLSEIVNECIDYAFEQLSPEYRTLNHVSQYFPVDFPRWPELRKWLRGSEQRTNGEYHWLFDNDNDALAFDFDKVGFDVTYLMDKAPHLISTPVYLYLMHRMSNCLDGRLTSFVIDEAWQLFASPYWVKCLSEWLPTIRKKNGHFIFMTQSPKTVTTSAIRHVVLDNLATLILFPNSLADRETYIEQLKLTESQFQFIKETPPESRIFLYKQANDALLCKLDLSELPDLIRILSGNTKSVKLLDELMREVGTNPDDWLLPFLARSAS